MRVGGKVIAQNTPTTGPLGVDLLLNATDYDAAVLQALMVFDRDQPNYRVVDNTIATAGFRAVLRGTGALAGLTGADAWAADSSMNQVWYPFDVASQGQEPVDANHYRIVRDPGKLVLEMLADSLQVGQVLRTEFTRPHTLTEAPNTVTDPAAAPTVSLISPAAAGNINVGLHSWVFVWKTAYGSTLPSPSASATITDNSVNGKVTIVVPASTEYGITGVDVFRTIAGDTGSRKLVGSLATNGGTVTDNVADVSLGAVVPSVNTAGGNNSVEDEDEQALITLVASMVLQMAANKAAQNTGNTNLPNDIVDRRSQSDIYRSRSKDLRAIYDSLMGRGGADSVGPASGFKDLDVESSDGRSLLWHRSR